MTSQFNKLYYLQKIHCFHFLKMLSFLIFNTYFIIQAKKHIRQLHLKNDISSSFLSLLFIQWFVSTYFKRGGGAENALTTIAQP